MADFHGRLLWPTFVADFCRLWPTFMADWPTAQSAGHFTVWPADLGRQKSASATSPSISAARTYCTTYNRKIRNPSHIVVVMRKKVSVGVGGYGNAEYIVIYPLGFRRYQNLPGFPNSVEISTER